jgi:hypothetical protein
MSQPVNVSARATRYDHWRALWMKWQTEELPNGKSLAIRRRRADGVTPASRDSCETLSA